jgi:1-acyl-sn-glycerol-3-phosphate acyltransferase
MLFVRSLLFQIWIVGVTALLGLVYLPALLGPRAWIARGARLGARATLWGLKVICGIRTEITGREHLPTGAALLAGKHQSMWETVAILDLLDDPSVVLKRELLFVPVYGWYTARLDMIVIRREAAAQALRHMVTAAKRTFAMGRPVVIFPEGTRKKPGAEPDYKPGIAALYNQLGVPVTPFALTSGAHWKGFWKHPGTLRLQFLPAIEPGLKRPVFMARLQAEIETATAALLAKEP